MAQGGEPGLAYRESEGLRAEEEQENEPDDNRESIWTIPARLKRWYFALFSIQIAIATVWLVKTAISSESGKGASDILLYVWQNMAPAAVSSATFALVIVDTVNGIMVLSTWLEDELKKRRQRQIRAAVEKEVGEAVEKAVAEAVEVASKASGNKARAEERQSWVEWNRRREAAAAAGLEFTEPPPGSRGRESQNSQ